MAASEVTEQQSAGPLLPPNAREAAASACHVCAESWEGRGQREVRVPNLVTAVLDRRGDPLDPTIRRSMESAFDADFSHVRVHVDALAARSAATMRALAYTVGNQIVFASGQYSPATWLGRRLIAHELAHVVQQSSAMRRFGRSAYWMDDDEEEGDSLESLADAAGWLAATPQSAFAMPRLDVQSTNGQLRLQRLGANPGCTQAQRETLHQAIFNANGWIKNALAKLRPPLTRGVLRSLRTNFGSTYGVAQNLDLFVTRIRYCRNHMNRIPIGCNSTDPICTAGHCGFAHAGSANCTICTATLGAGVDWRFQARCVLHECFHAAFSRFSVDHYSTGHGTSAASPTYPGTGTDPLLNADSYTTLVMDLS